MYVFVDTATSDDRHAPVGVVKRPATFEGFMSRFVVRHGGTPTAKMQAMLREAYKAGAVDGAAIMARLSKTAADRS